MTRFLSIAIGILVTFASIAVAEDVWVTSIATHPSGGRYAGSATGLLLRPSEVYRWTDDAFDDRTVIATHPAAVWCVDVCDNGSHVASSDYRGNLQIIDTVSGEAKMHQGIFERWTQAMRFAPNGDTIVAGNEAGKFFVFADGGITKTVDVDKNAITDIDFSAAGDRIVLSDGGGLVHLFTWPAMEPAGKIKVGDSPAWAVRFSPDASILLVGSGDRHLYRCAAADGAAPEVILNGTDWVTRIAVTTTGAIAAGEVGGKVYVLANANPPTPDTPPAGTAPSGVWALHWSGPSRLMVGTRKNGVMPLEQAWTFAEAAAPAEPQSDESSDDDH